MNQSTGADSKELDEVEISSIMPPDPSSLPVSSIADRYTRSMLEYMVGYPLYEPRPFSQFSKEEYSRHGVNVGDVGFIRNDGTFDFLFNICPPKNGLINPPNLPDGFSLETPEQSETRNISPLPCETCFFPRTVTETASGEYMCKGPAGAILVLPEGGIQDEAIDIGWFEDLAKLHGVEWYKYTMTRGRSISNGSLYLITSFTKSTQWGIGVFDRPCDPGQGLKFVSSPFSWKGPKAVITKVADPKQGDTANQCVFLRGYKIMIRQDIFDKLPTRQQATRIRGGGGTGFSSKIKKLLTGESSLTRTPMSAVTKSDDVVLHADFNSSPVHPSDFINAALLDQNPDAKVALTHDDVWCDLLRDNFPKLNYAELMNIARLYTSTIDEYGCISLEKIRDSSNVLDELNNRPLRGAEAPALEEHIQEARNERNPDISMQAQASTTLRPLPVDRSHGDEGIFDISLSQAPYTTAEVSSQRNPKKDKAKHKDPTMSDEPYTNLLPVLQERYQCPHFRVLVAGRANAGKTTILERVCKVGHDIKPIVYDRKGKKVDTWWSKIKYKHYLSPTQVRGEHDIEHQITYPGSNFIFHDSRGFESGSRDEMILVRQFLEERSTKAADMHNRVHVIWYCIPMDDARIIAGADLDFLQHSTGEVPVVVVFTKFDVRIVQEYIQLPEDLDVDERWELAVVNANRTLQDIYIPLVNNTPHPPAGIVHLEDMHKADKQCAELTEKTAEVINDTTLRRLFVSVQKNNTKLCIKEAINGMVSDILQQRSSPSWDHIAFSAMCYFPHCWDSSWKYDQSSGMRRLEHGV